MSRPDVETVAAPESRRSFLSRSAVVAAAAAPAALLVAGQATPAHARTNRPPGNRGLPELYPGWNARNFHEIQADENAHVAALLAALGSQARPKPNFQNLTTTDVFQFAGFSYAFENTGAGAYLGAAPAIYDKGYLKEALMIAQVEAYHSGYINTLVNFPITPAGAPFIYPYTIQQVIQNAGPFIADLNGGPPLSFDPVNPSPQNDIAILNFALALEFLEREFYNINVPTYFG